MPPRGRREVMHRVAYRLTHRPTHHLTLGGLLAGAACAMGCTFVKPPPTEAIEFKGQHQPVKAILALGAQQVSSERLRALLVPGQTMESNPHGLPRFKFEFQAGGQYSGYTELPDGYSLFSTGGYWVEDEGRFCLIYRGEFALAPYPVCGFLWELNGRFFYAQTTEPDAPVTMRIFRRPF